MWQLAWPSLALLLRKRGVLQWILSMLNSTLHSRFFCLVLCCVAEQGTLRPTALLHTDLLGASHNKGAHLLPHAVRSDVWPSGHA